MINILLIAGFAVAVIYLITRKKKCKHEWLIMNIEETRRICIKCSLVQDLNGAWK